MTVGLNDTAVELGLAHCWPNLEIGQANCATVFLDMAKCVKLEQEYATYDGPGLQHSSGVSVAMAYNVNFTLRS